MKKLWLQKFPAGSEGHEINLKWKTSGQSTPRAGNPMLGRYADNKKNRIKTIAMNLLSKFLVGVALLGATFLGKAQVTLTFDDVSPSLYVQITNGYGGLGWYNFLIQNGLELAPTNNGLVSSPNVALNMLGKPASFFSSSRFTFDSAYFTSVYANQDELAVQGFAGTTELYSNIYTIYHDSLTLINFNYTGIDRVVFSTSAGAYFTMDNLVMTVPEPRGYALIWVGVALGGFNLWRKLPHPQRIVRKGPRS